MKKITVINYEEKRKSTFLDTDFYTVYIHSELKIKFKNRVHAEQFLIDISKFFNSKLNELNMIYIDVFREYRYAWFYDSSDEILRIINLIEKTFLRLVSSNSPNHNYFVFKDILAVCDNITYICDEIIKINEKNKIYNAVNRIKTFKFNVERIINELNSYSKN